MSVIPSITVEKLFGENDTVTLGKWYSVMDNNKLYIPHETSTLQMVKVIGIVLSVFSFIVAFTALTVGGALASMNHNFTFISIATPILGTVLIGSIAVAFVAGIKESKKLDQPICRECVQTALQKLKTDNELEAARLQNSLYHDESSSKRIETTRQLLRDI